MSVSYMSREAYDKLDRVNFSTLKHIARSPAHYRHNLLNGRPDTDALKLGRCDHLAVIEPERFRLECVRWDGDRRAGKKWEAFKAQSAGREILKEDEWAHCLALSEAVRRDVTASRYLSGGKGEQTVLWTDKVTGVECKARLDFISALPALVDLKSTRNASPGSFGRDVWNFSYHVQAAYYADGYEAATGQRPPYVLVAVEKDAPHVCQVYRMPDAVLQLGRETYRNMLETLLECRQNNRWPGYGGGAELELELPSWAANFGESDDLAALDLVISQ